MSGIKRYLSDNAYKAAEHSESPSESNPFVTLSKAIAMRSDWNENDTTQYDYILNRTHYVDYIPTDYEAEEATFVEAGGYASASIYGWSSGHSLYPEGFTQALAEGMPFKFVIGDTTYEGIAHRSGGSFYAGNKHIVNNLFPDTGESWCVYSGQLGMATLDFYIDSSYIGTTQNIVPTTYSEVVHQLPTKFINSDLATKQDALGFTPENSANKKTTLADNSDTYYPTQKAVKTAVDSKATGAASSVANEVPVYDGTTGKVLKSGSGVSAVGGNLTIGGTITANGQQILPQKQTDWNQTTSEESDYIKNKPAIKAGQGVNSSIEGDLAGNSSTGDYSHAEGNGTTASGGSSHAEGRYTTASGWGSHAEGSITTASADFSHAEGRYTTASGWGSHAEGGGTTAKNRYQRAFGEFNELDPSTALSSARGTYIEIVGNGATSSARSNARTLDWSGNEVLAGKITANGVNLNDALNLKQDALGFTPEDSANKKTTLDDNSDTYYPTQKAVKTAVDSKATGAASSTDNELAVYNGTTGKALKSGSGVSAVGGNLTATNDMASATKTIANKVRMAYDSATDTLKFNFL